MFVERENKRERARVTSTRIYIYFVGLWAGFIGSDAAGPVVYRRALARPLNPRIKLLAMPPPLLIIPLCGDEDPTTTMYYIYSNSAFAS